jgi:hypothetical protein
MRRSCPRSHPTGTPAPGPRTRSAPGSRSVPHARLGRSCASRRSRGLQRPARIPLGGVGSPGRVRTGLRWRLPTLARHPSPTNGWPRSGLIDHEQVWIPVGHESVSLHHVPLLPIAVETSRALSTRSSLPCSCLTPTPIARDQLVFEADTEHISSKTSRSVYDDGHGDVRLVRALRPVHCAACGRPSRTGKAKMGRTRSSFGDRAWQNRWTSQSRRNHATAWKRGQSFASLRRSTSAAGVTRTTGRTRSDAATVTYGRKPKSSSVVSSSPRLE